MADPRELQLETPRLLLRPLRLEDFEPWARFMDDEVATRFIGGRQLRATAWRGFMTMCGCWHSGQVTLSNESKLSASDSLQPWT